MDFTKNSYLFAVNEACQAMASAWCLLTTQRRRRVCSLCLMRPWLCPRAPFIYSKASAKPLFMAPTPSWLAEGALTVCHEATEASVQ